MKTEQRTRGAEESYRQILFAEEFEVVAENLLVVASEARRLGDLAGNPKNTAPQWAQLANRVRVVLAESRRTVSRSPAVALPMPARRAWVRYRLWQQRRRRI